MVMPSLAGYEDEKPFDSAWEEVSLYAGSTPAICTIFLFGGEDVAKYQNWLEPEALLLIEAWARDGLTDEQIASNMGIATSTLYNWKNDHLEILEALKKGKEVVDIQVENALLKRALGYTYKETTSECDEDGELKVTKVVTKEVVPDTTAQIFWLKNRRPDLWRDKQNIEHSGQINNPFADLTTEELRKLADAE